MRKLLTPALGRSRLGADPARWSLGGAALLYLLHSYGGGLPDHRQLADYEPPTVTRVHAGDGRLLAEYAPREPGLRAGRGDPGAA